jgi:hypothetical protein
MVEMVIWREIVSTAQNEHYDNPVLADTTSVVILCPFGRLKLFINYKNMADTITRGCRLCEEDFDSIYEIDRGVCESCTEEYLDHDCHKKIDGSRYYYKKLNIKQV